MGKKRENSDLDESLRRLSGILASPSLALCYGHTTPLAERAWLHRAGLTGAQAEELMDMLCRRGLMDVGARQVAEALCARRRIRPEQAVQLLLRGEGWPEDDDIKGGGAE